MGPLDEAKRDVVIANRILAHEGVVDAWGHVSVRHPDVPERYLLSRSRSPELVELDDVLEFRLDGDPVDDKGQQLYYERFIHGAIYEQRPDVHSVVHNHANEIIPFTVTQTPIRPLLHVAALIGAEIPNWDIRKKFGDTNMLVVNRDMGHDLAAALGAAHVVLMRGHGCSVAGKSVLEAVLTAIYLKVNAQLQTEAMKMGEITFLSPGEIALMREVFTMESAISRVWEYFKFRAGIAAI